MKSITFMLCFTLWTGLPAAASELIEFIVNAEKTRIEHLVDTYWDEVPVTVTSSFCDRSAGGIHDFYSEGDYWWPDPEDPTGPYIRKDGMSNPDNFSEHRHAMVRMNRIVGAMASAYVLSGEDKYVIKAMEHLEAWFIDDNTRMNPNMLYSQAIMGRVTGRGIGIIDGLHLAEVARAIFVMQDSDAISEEDLLALKQWFQSFLTWISTHPYGKSEMVHPNNHGTCWALQASAFAKLTGNKEMLEFCAKRFSEVLLPSQMGLDGSFPLELERTKPYGYSLFNLDAMSSLVQILSEGDTDFWKYTTEDGRSMHLALEFMFPYIKDKTSWPYEQDVLYWDSWPVRQPSLFLGALAFGKKNYLEVWKKLESDPEIPEIQRNLILRYPLLWMNTVEGKTPVQSIFSQTERK
jgi:hypothetical protein